MRMTAAGHLRHAWLVLPAAGLALALAACSAPVRVTRENPQAVHRQLTRNVLSAGEASDASLNVLHQWGLEEQFYDDPPAALATLRQVVVDGRGTGNDVFALAELSFLAGEDSGDHAQYLAAAVYAWAFVFPSGAEHAPRRFDPRVRVALDIYNRALAMAFADGEYVRIQGGVFPLPFGSLSVAFDPAQLQWNERELRNFVPTAELRVDGLRQRYRWPGVGAPLAASTVRRGGDPDKLDLVGPAARVPVTALLRLPDARQQIAGDHLSGTLELYASNVADTVDINGRTVPLEVESTSSLAYSLAGRRTWDWELEGFFFGDLLAKEPSKLMAMEPYQRGRFPVVFVHGTASSPARWAEMVNDLANDSRLRDCFQFWFYFYDTGNPITYSAYGLRESLTEAVAAYDPDDSDPPLRRMVVVGHSQGGLLTKMTAVDTGTAMYDWSFKKPIDSLVVSESTREFLRKSLFITPLPFVSRVVFVATPHHGSYIAGSALAQWVAGFASLPQDLVQTTGELLRGSPEAVMFTSVDDIQGSVRNMTPGNRFVQSLAEVQVAPGVGSHSIIPVTGEAPPDGQDDGVVEYESARITPVDSELVIFDASHSVQGHPQAIEEVRRILLLHAEQERARGVVCGDPDSEALQIGSD